MSYELKIDGAFKNEATERACEKQQIGGWRLTQITTAPEPKPAGGVTLWNKALFERTISSKILPNLDFQELGTRNADQLRTQMENIGWTFICEADIYVESISSRVLIFGRKKFTDVQANPD